MKKLLHFILFITFPMLSFAQGSWQSYSNNIERKINGSDTSFRFNAGSKGSTEVYNKYQTIKNISTALPTGQRGQLLKVSVGNSNKYLAQDPLIYGQFVYNTDQLNRALSSGESTQREIFNTFKRFAHGGNVADPNGALHPSDTIPLIPIQTNSYSYDTVNNVVFSLTNTSAHTGFISRDKYTHYVHRATLTATGIGSPTTGQAGLNNGYDNDVVAMVIAFVEDSTHMVKNNAFGLNPSDFTWPIDVTSQFIPDQHTLTLIRNRNGTLNAYVIYYDYGKLTQVVIANGTSGVQATAANWQGAEVDTQVSLNEDTVTTLTTNYSDTPGGKGALAHSITVLLTSNPLLEKFRHGVSYGYSTQSQANASFKNIYFSGSSNVIYDLRSGDVYRFGSSGYTIDPTINMYSIWGPKFFWRNIKEHTYGYVLSDNTYDVIVGTP